jgi:hypothetical protein
MLLLVGSSLLEKATLNASKPSIGRVLWMPEVDLPIVYTIMSIWRIFSLPE